MSPNDDLVAELRLIVDRLSETTAKVVALQGGGDLVTAPVVADLTKYRATVIALLEETIESPHVLIGALQGVRLYREDMEYLTTLMVDAESSRAHSHDIDADVHGIRQEIEAEKDGSAARRREAASKRTTQSGATGSAKFLERPRRRP
jgi:hypothetical protein